MPRGERKALIERIEEARESRVVCYVTGDRAPAPAQLGDDAVRTLYDHLRPLGQVPRLDVFIYSRGGSIDVPWRIATALRAASDEWNMLVPFRANSAATLLGLGADEIILGRQGELGPIDPIMGIQRQVPQPGGPPVSMQENLSVEDVMAYGRFVRERAGLSDQDALARSLDKLAERLDAVSLGNAYRTHTHIREVARRMLLSRRDPTTEQAMATIIETLAERVYAHGHAIGLSEAADIGLPVKPAPDEVEPLLWELLGHYETDLSLLEPLDPFAALAGKAEDRHEEPWPSAIIESSWGAHEFVGRLEVTGRRQMPQNLSVTVNAPLVLPPGLDVATLPQQAQQLLQQLIQTAQQAVFQGAQQAVHDALKRQAPLTGIDFGLRDAAWRRSTSARPAWRGPAQARWTRGRAPCRAAGGPPRARRFQSRAGVGQALR